MMSLFNSFDVGFYFLNFLIFGSFLIFLVSKVYANNYTHFLLFIAPSKILHSFFLSLKPNCFGKETLIFIYCLFFMLFYFNLTSVFSFNFPLSSQVSIIFFISLLFWSSFFLFFLFKNFKGFLSHCIPEGTPLYLTFFLFIIELASMIIRPLTLTVRLVANIVAGHLLMILLSKMVLSLSLTFSIFYLVLNAVEIFVAMIQSYIFSTMLTLYFSEVN